VHIRVDSSPGRHGVEIPRRLRFGDRVVTVLANIDQWDGFDHHYFKLEGDDGNLYILRSDEVGADWEVVMFQNPRAGAGSAQFAERKVPPAQGMM